MNGDTFTKNLFYFRVEKRKRFLKLLASSGVSLTPRERELLRDLRMELAANLGKEIAELDNYKPPLPEGGKSD
jgi:hypothetical protein